MMLPSLEGGEVPREECLAGGARRLPLRFVVASSGNMMRLGRGKLCSEKAPIGRDCSLLWVNARGAACSVSSANCVRQLLRASYAHRLRWLRGLMQVIPLERETIIPSRHPRKGVVERACMHVCACALRQMVGHDTSHGACVVAPDKMGVLVLP